MVRRPRGAETGCGRCSNTPFGLQTAALRPRPFPLPEVYFGVSDIRTVFRPLSRQGGSPPLATEEDLMEDRPSDRDLLIALAATSALSRAAVCRLAAELDRWARGEDPCDPKQRAAELGLPPIQLTRARALLP